MQIQLATDEAQRLAAYRLRYAVYIREMNYHPSLADHRQGTMSDRHDPGSSLIIASEGERVVASLRIHFGDTPGLPDDFARSFDLDRFAPRIPTDRMLLASRFVVDAAYRQRSLPFRLIEYAYRLAVERGSELAFLACLPHLIPLYQKLGLRRIGPAFCDEEAGMLSPMCLVVRDLGWLRERRSPLHPVASRLLADAVRPDWVDSLFRSDQDAADETQAIRHWSKAFGLLGAEGPGRQGVLRDFSAQELQQLIDRGVVISCHAGEKLILQGSAHRNLYIVLEGSCEVRLGDRVLGLHGAGELIGEMAWLLDMPRSADVFAVSDPVRLLSLTERDLQRLLATPSTEAMKLLLNLSRTLGARMLALRELIA